MQSSLVGDACLVFYFHLTVTVCSVVRARWNESVRHDLALQAGELRSFESVLAECFFLKKAKENFPARHVDVELEAALSLTGWNQKPAVSPCLWGYLTLVSSRLADELLCLHRAHRPLTTA